MELLNTILNANNGSVLRQLADTFGIGEEDAKNAVTKLSPELAKNIKNNAGSSDGFRSLINALNNGDHQRYLKNPETLSREDAINEGNGILGHVLGGKDASRQLANDAAGSTGLDTGIVKKMLPMVATLVMGSLSKQASGSNMMSQLNQDSPDSGILGQFVSFLDADNDGSVVDDVIGLARRFF